MQESCVHSLVFICLLTYVWLTHLIFLISMRMRCKGIISSIYISRHHDKTSIALLANLRISAELIYHILLRWLWEYLWLGIEVIVEFTGSTSLWYKPVSGMMHLLSRRSFCSCSSSVIHSISYRGMSWLCLELENRFHPFSS